MILNEIIISILEAEFIVPNPAWFIFITILLAVMPIAVGLLTSFVKISIVLGIIKNALGTQHAPGSMVSLALSLALTMLIMSPVIKESKNIAENINSSELMKSSTAEIVAALKPLSGPWRKFLEKNCGQKELQVIHQSLQLAAEDRQPDLLPAENDQADRGFEILIPAFLLTELKEGFTMAFLLLLPFLAVDLIVANILMGLGMMMLSPVIISMPIKLILFVVSDAWLILTQALIRSYLQ